MQRTVILDILDKTRKYPLCRNILGVLTLTTAWDRQRGVTKHWQLKNHIYLFILNKEEIIDLQTEQLHCCWYSPLRLKYISHKKVGKTKISFHFSSTTEYVLSSIKCWSEITKLIRLLNLGNLFCKIKAFFNLQCWVEGSLQSLDSLMRHYL